MESERQTNRNNKGRFLPGVPMPEDLKKAISEGQVRRHRQRRMGEDHFVDLTKKCTQCGEVKVVPDDFVVQKRKLKSGEYTYYPSGACKRCSVKRAHQWKQDFIAKHGIEAYKERERHWNVNRNQEKKRRYNREYGRMRRAEEGAHQRGPWKRYRNEGGQKTKVMWITALPFRQWWRTLPSTTRHKIICEDDTLRRQIDRIVCGEQLNVKLEFLDEIAQRMEDPTLVAKLSQRIF